MQSKGIMDSLYNYLKYTRLGLLYRIIMENSFVSQRTIDFIVFVDFEEISHFRYDSCGGWK